jgi:hypothetical protein
MNRSAQMETKMATVVTAPAPPSLAALKSKQQVAWYAANGAVVGATLQIPGESVRKALETGTDSLQRCEHALELLLTHRGNPSVEVDRVLADDPHSVFGHCLRAALIVCADA